MKWIQKVKLVSERTAHRLFGWTGSRAADQSHDQEQCDEDELEEFVDPIAEGEAIDEVWTDDSGDVWEKSNEELTAWVVDESGRETQVEVKTWRKRARHGNP